MFSPAVGERILGDDRQGVIAGAYSKGVSENWHDLGGSQFSQPSPIGALSYVGIYSYSSNEMKIFTLFPCSFSLGNASL
jgi:hypothetical protein